MHCKSAMVINVLNKTTLLDLCVGSHQCQLSSVLYSYLFRFLCKLLISHCNLYTTKSSSTLRLFHRDKLIIIQCNLYTIKVFNIESRYISLRSGFQPTLTARAFIYAKWSRETAILHLPQRLQIFTVAIQEASVSRHNGA